MTATATRPLFEVTADLVKLNELLDEIEGDLSRAPEGEAAIAEWMDGLQMERGQKVDAYINLIRQRETRAAARREEAERYLAGAKTDENCAKWLKDSLKNHMEITGETKIETATGRIVAVQKNGGKVPVEIDPATVPAFIAPAYQRTTIEFDKEAIRGALESGTELEWAKLGERGTSLRIR